MNKIISFFFLLTFFLVNSAFADSQTLCAAVYPCDDEGNLMEQYASPESPCLDYYIGQCLVVKLQISKNNNQACEFQKSDLEATLNALEASENKYRKLKKKLRQLRSARK